MDRGTQGERSCMCQKAKKWILLINH